MNESLLNMILIIVIGTLVSLTVFFILNKSIKKIIWFFQLYPESQSMLNFSLKFISGFISTIVFLLFLRVGLRQAGLEFTSKFIEDTILILPKYIFAISILLLGKYATKITDGIFEKYSFKYKQEFLAVVNMIFFLTFVITSLSIIGVNVDIFSEIFKTIIFSLGLIIALIIGIPVGLRLYDSGAFLEKKKSRNKRK